MGHPDTMEPTELRRRAEEELARGRESPVHSETFDGLRAALTELRVHQLELQMQNEELRRLQAELELEQERYRELYEFAPVGYLTLSSNAFVTEANRTLEAMLGVPRSELLGQAFTRFIHPEDQDVWYLERRRSWPAGVSRRCELRLIDANGAPRWVQLQASVASARGVEPGHRIVLADITEAKQRQEQLRAYQKLRTMGGLVGGVAHDFNNMLCVILSCAELAVTAPGLPEGVRGDLDEILRATEEGRRLMGQLLAFGRQPPVARGALDLNDLVLELEKRFRRVLGREIALVLRLASELDLTGADRGEVEQVLTNLVLNARDALPRGGIITISTAPLALSAVGATGHGDLPPGQYSVLTVSDDGIGIDAALRERIFEPFFTTKELGKGTGLGLAEVEGIVAQQGGAVWVDSELGQGARFSVAFPCV